MVTPGGRSNSMVQPVIDAVVGFATTYLSSHHEPLAAAENVAVSPVAACAGSAVITTVPMDSSTAAARASGRARAIMGTSPETLSVKFLYYTGPREVVNDRYRVRVRRARS